MNESSGFTPASPELRPKGYGGIHPAGRRVDPFFDFDLSDKITSLVNDLLEHPATRPHLERFELSYRSHARGILLACARCEVSPCSCGNLHDRTCQYMVSIFQDSVLRPLFDQRNLEVRGA